MTNQKKRCCFFFLFFFSSWLTYTLLHIYFGNIHHTFYLFWTVYANYLFIKILLFSLFHIFPPENLQLWQTMLSTVQVFPFVRCYLPESQHPDSLHCTEYLKAQFPSEGLTLFFCNGAGLFFSCFHNCAALFNHFFHFFAQLFPPSTSFFPVPAAAITYSRSVMQTRASVVCASACA